MTEMVVKMPGASSIGGIQALRDNLFFAASQNNNVLLDASKVKKSDTATIQVLASMAITLKEKGGELKWVERSEQIDEQAKLLGLCKLIGIDG